MSGSIAIMPSPSDLDSTSIQIEASTQQASKTEARITPPGASSRKHTELIFDWDDTLLPSTWLVKQGLRLDFPEVIPANVRPILKRLENGIIALLTSAQQFGKVVIITNAETGWVELSAQRFIPGVVPYLQNIKVLSARSTFESQYPEPFDWKVAAFRQEVGKFVTETQEAFQLENGCTNGPLVSTPSSTEEKGAHDDMQNSFTRPGGMDLENYPERASSPNGNLNDTKVNESPVRSIISFGDSVHERDAVWIVTKNVPNAFTKSIKFVERPSAEQLCKEIDLVCNCMDYVCNYVGELDLMLTISLLGSHQEKSETEEDGNDSPASSDSEIGMF